MIKPEIIRANKFKADKELLEKECLELWAFTVKVRVNFICEYPNCYKVNNLNAHHLYTKAKKSTKFDLQNGMCLCPYHHTLGAEAAHRDPEFKTIIVDNNIRTQSFLDTLRIKAFTPTKVDLYLEKLYLINELNAWLKKQPQKQQRIKKHLTKTWTLFVDSN